MHFLLANCVRPPGQIVKDGRTFVELNGVTRDRVRLVSYTHTSQLRSGVIRYCRLLSLVLPSPVH
jgi:hypothetical protein